MISKLRNKLLPGLAVAVFLLCCIALALAVFFNVLSTQSLRLDEAQSLWQTGFSFQGMLTQVIQDVHVPLYHSILHFWNLYWGANVVQSRLLSLIFFVLSIPALYLLTSKYFSKKIALFTTLLFTLSPFMNWYASEIRMYTLLVLITILSHYAFLAVWKRNRPSDWVMYVITGLLGVLTHYYFTMILLAQACFYFLARKQFPKNSLRKFIIAAVIIIIPLAIWGYLFIHGGAGNNTRPQLSIPNSVDVFNAFVSYIIGFWNNYSTLESLWPIAVLFIFMLIARKQKITSVSMYFLVQIIVPLTVILAISRLLFPIFLARYLIIILPALYLVLIWYISGFREWLELAMLTGVVAVFLFGFVHLITTTDLPVTEDYQSVSQFLTDNTSPRDVIAISAPFTFYPLEYYYNGPRAITTIPFWDSTLHGKIPEFSTAGLIAQTNDLAKNYDSIWLVLSYDQGYQKTIKQYFDQHYQRLYSKIFANGIEVDQYKFKYH